MKTEHSDDIGMFCYITLNVNTFHKSKSEYPFLFVSCLRKTDLYQAQEGSVLIKCKGTWSYISNITKQGNYITFFKK